MSKTSFAAWDVDDVDTIYDVEYETVSTCPTCCFPLQSSTLDLYHVVQNPVSSTEQPLHQVYAMCFCPKCRTIFMCKYTAIPHPEQADVLDCITLDELIPSPKVKIFTSECIQNISDCFPITYAQSKEAELLQLDHVANLGYRMSLQILIKDYLSAQFPEDAVKIRAESLVDSMRRIPDSRFQPLADILEGSQNISTPRLKSILQALLGYIESEAAIESSLLMHS